MHVKWKYVRELHNQAEFVYANLIFPAKCSFNLLYVCIVEFNVPLDTV